MSNKKSSRGRKAKKESKQTPAIPDCRSIEQQMAQIDKLLNSREFGSIEEAQAFINETLNSGNLPEMEPSTPLEEAQEIMYGAWEARGKQRERLARKALEVSPECADAYVLLASISIS